MVSHGPPMPLAGEAPSRARGPSGLGEFFLVGGATFVLFPLAWILRRAFGLDPAEYAVGFFAFYAAHVINDPHFAVTYVLFYKDVRARAFGTAFPPWQRVRYWITGLLVPLALLAWGAVALAYRSPRGIGWMMEVMYALVGWHYAKQAFGVAMVLSARRGVTYRPIERTALLVHSFAGWAYAWANPAMPSRAVEEKGVVYFSLPHPRVFERFTLFVFLASAVLLAVVLARKWRLDRRLPPVAPLVGFLVTIWLWTVFTSLNRLMMYVIPGLHSIQYLYFVWLLRRNEARAEEGPPHFGRAVGTRLAALAATSVALGWLLFNGLPAFLDALRRQSGPEELGVTPWAAVLFAFVNIHHYFMDHVIWRRENPDTRFLRDA